MTKNLRTNLKTDAERQLAKLVGELMATAEKMEAKHGVAAADLLKLAVGGRSKSINARCVTTLVAGFEKDLLKLYNKQQKLDLSESDGQ